jgi:uncharacterized protein (DUF4213/DUF364 family)
MQRPLKGMGKLLEASAKTLAGYALSDHPLESTIGMAALNSLIPIDESWCTEDNAFTILSALSPGKRVAIVGNFPFIDKLKPVAGELTIIQKAKGDIPVLSDSDKKSLERADIAAITGTSLINHSLDEILSFLNKNATKMMLGPTTPLSPVLFDLGFDYLSGVKVTEEEKVLKYISQGATFREIEGVKLLTMRNRR